MKIAIFENIMTPGGHEVDFDRILVEELTQLGHEVSFYVPENFVFSFDYKGRVPVVRLKGAVSSYAGTTGLRKALRAAKQEYNRQGWYKQLYKCAQKGQMDAIIVPTCTYRYLRALKVNPFKNSPVPVLFIMHGIIPKDKENFFRETTAVKEYPNIRPVVMTLGNKLFGRKPENAVLVYPPTYVPRDIDYVPEFKVKPELKIGFLGNIGGKRTLTLFWRLLSRDITQRNIRFSCKERL